MLAVFQFPFGEGWHPTQTLHMAQSAPLHASLHCYRHHRHCPIQTVHIDITGTPCQDYSHANHNKAGIFGDRFKVFVVWGQIILRSMVPVFVHENVCGQPSSLFHSMFGAYYDMFFCLSCLRAWWASV